MSNAPLPLTIVIATWNRCSDLELTLESLATIEPVSEILVVDNASTDDTAAMVRRRFPSVTLLRQETNLGVPGFGVGVTLARQELVFLLDDDAIPAPGCLTRALALMESEANIAVIACHILDGAGHAVTDCWPRNPLCFWGCGALVRRAATTADKHFFDPRLRLHGTEMDLCIRLRARGLSVRYAPECVVHHRFSPTNRSSATRIRSLVPNALWFPLKHLPARYAAPAAARYLALLGWRATRAGVAGAYLAGLQHAMRSLPDVWRERRVVPRSVARAYYRGVWEFEPLSARMLRALVGWPSARSTGSNDFEDLVR